MRFRGKTSVDGGGCHFNSGQTNGFNHAAYRHTVLPAHQTTDANLFCEPEGRRRQDDRDSLGRSGAPQRTLTWWAEKVGAMPMANLKRGAAAPQYLLVDTPGAIGPDLEKGVAGADLIILVAEMGIASLHSTARTVPILRRAAPDARLAILFNKVRTNTLTGRQDPAELAKGLGAPALPTSMPLRASFELFVGQGWTALPGPDRELAAQIALCVVTA